MKVKEIVALIERACPVPEVPRTCDLLMTGSWEAEVTGIVTTFMATVEVIKASVACGANLIITHEPTYFTGWEDREWLVNDKVYVAKKCLLEENHINIWRFHDHMHAVVPDLVYQGLVKELGWEAYWEKAHRSIFTIPAIGVRELADFFKKKLNVKTVQLVGDTEGKIQRVGILVGGGSLGLGREEMPAELMRTADLDTIVCGEITEWTLPAYVRDAAQLGMHKSLIILGHNRTEEVGMKHLPAWLHPLLPGMPITFVEAGEPFAYC